MNFSIPARTTGCYSTSTTQQINSNQELSESCHLLSSKSILSFSFFVDRIIKQRGSDSNGTINLGNKRPQHIVQCRGRSCRLPPTRSILPMQQLYQSKDNGNDLQLEIGAEIEWVDFFPGMVTRYLLLHFFKWTHHFQVILKICIPFQVFSISKGLSKSKDAICQKWVKIKIADLSTL